MYRLSTIRCSFLLFIISFILTSPARADFNIVNVVFMDFKYGGKITKQLFKKFKVSMNKQLTDSGDIYIISGQELELILLKNNIQKDKCKSINCMSKIGKLSNAPIIVSVSLLGRRNKYFLDIFIIDATNSKVLFTEHVEGVYSKFVQEASQSVKKIIKSIIDKEYPLAEIEIISKPEQADVIINNQIVGKTPVKFGIRQNIIYDLQLDKQNYESYNTTTIFQKRRNNVSITLHPLKGILQIAGFPYGSKVIINGRFEGSLPKLFYKNNPGDYNLQVKKSGYKKYSRSVVIKPGVTQDIQIRLKRKPKLPSMISSTIVPGTGQMIRGKPLKGLLFTAAAIGLGYLAYHEHLAFEQRKEIYQEHLDIYNNQLDLNQIDQDIDRVWNSFDNMNNKENRRNQILYALGTVWTFNVFEIMLD